MAEPGHSPEKCFYTFDLISPDIPLVEHRIMQAISGYAAQPTRSSLNWFGASA
jgi:hypothetical protein